ETLEAARDLGAGSVVVFRTILLPLTATGVRIAFAFAFVLASGDYITPQLLGGTNGLMIGNAISDQFTTQFNWPLGCALAIVMLLVSLAVCWLFSRLLRLSLRSLIADDSSGGRSGRAVCSDASDRCSSCSSYCSSYSPRWC